MPFLVVDYPTIGVPLLSRILRDRNIDCSVFYFAELFRDSCSPEMYDLILADSGDNELGDWLFSRKTFQLDSEYLDQKYPNKKEILLKIRDKFEIIIDALSTRDWSLFTAIGFSCTFLQLVPSLCLSKFIKKRHPDIEIILGGGNMLPNLSKEVLKNCPWIDTVFLGEAEKSLPYYLETGQTDTQGIMWRDSGNIRSSGIAKMEVQDIQNLPIPDYDDYFNSSSKEKKLSIQIGRGCIYNKCNFCVYCDHSAYRKGSITNSIDQMKYLIDRYNIKDVFFIDLIMPPNAFKNLPDIPNIKYSFCISSFTWSYEHLPYLEGQDCTIGIETFHPQILKLMNKEQSIIKCISILKWLKRYDVNTAYMLLYGTIHEKGEWYDEILELIQHLTHLQPPIDCLHITHHRDNTYLTQEDYKESSVYQQIYPNSFNLRKMARVFEVNSAKISMEQIKAWSHIKPVLDFVQQWKADYLTRSICLYRSGNTVTDTRYGQKRYIKLSDSQIDILEKCHYPTKEDLFLDYTPEDMTKLINAHLILHMEGQYLNLIDPDVSLKVL